MNNKGRPWTISYSFFRHGGETSTSCTCPGRCLALEFRLQSISTGRFFLHMLLYSEKKSITWSYLDSNGILFVWQNPRFGKNSILRWYTFQSFRNIKLKPAKLSLPDGTKLPDAHELWISQDKRLQVMALITIWEATDLDFEVCLPWFRKRLDRNQTLMKMVPATLTFLLVLHWIRRKCNMQDWEIYAFLATHVRMRHFTCDQIWRMDDIMVAKGEINRESIIRN